jgi:hypothetical protein
MGAGCYVAGSEQGAMYRSERVLKEIYFGNDSESLYLRLDPLLWKNVTVRIDFHGPRHTALEFVLESFVGLASYLWTDATGAVSQHRALAAVEVVELAVPLVMLGLDEEEIVRFQVKVLEEGLERECYPERVPIEFNLIRKDYALEHWMV